MKRGSCGGGGWRKGRGSNERILGKEVAGRRVDRIVFVSALPCPALRRQTPTDLVIDCCFSQTCLSFII